MEVAANHIFDFFYISSAAPRVFFSKSGARSSCFPLLIFLFTLNGIFCSLSPSISDYVPIIDVLDGF